MPYMWLISLCDSHLFRFVVISFTAGLAAVCGLGGGALLSTSLLWVSKPRSDLLRVDLLKDILWNGVVPKTKLTLLGSVVGVQVVKLWVQYGYPAYIRSKKAKTYTLDALSLLERTVSLTDTEETSSKFAVDWILVTALEPPTLLAAFIGVAFQSRIPGAWTRNLMIITTACVLVLTFFTAVKKSRCPRSSVELQLKSSTRLSAGTSDIREAENELTALISVKPSRSASQAGHKQIVTGPPIIASRHFLCRLWVCIAVVHILFCLYIHGPSRLLAEGTALQIGVGLALAIFYTSISAAAGTMLRYSTIGNASYWTTSPSALGQLLRRLYGIVGGTIAGFATGLLGIGGGLIKAPYMNMVGVPGPIIVDSSGIMILLTSASNSMNFLLDDRIPLSEATFLFMCGFAGGASGYALSRRFLSTNSHAYSWYMCFIVALTLGGMVTV